MNRIVTRELACGMMLVIEPIPSVASAVLSWRLPVGSAGDPADADGLSAMLSELLFRGAGGMSSRALSESLDRCGVRRSSHTMTHHLLLEMTCLGERLEEALPLVTAMVREPTLPDDAVEPVRSLCIQSLDGLSDEPQHLAMIKLQEQHHAPPFNRSGYGTREAIETITGEGLRSAWQERCLPRGSILCAAGAVDPESLVDMLEPRLAAWVGEHTEPEPSGPPSRGYLHIDQSTAQVHIALAYDAPPERDENAMLERLATSILGGSTSGRLFSEVRQKRSLCYSVGASYRARRDDGVVSIYAGTTPERAQETIDVCFAEIDRLFSDTGEGVSAEEFERAVVGLKSRLVMQGESTPARANALGTDYFRLGRARSLDELAAAVDAITLEQLRTYVRARDPEQYTIVSIGPAPLEVAGSRSKVVAPSTALR